MQEVIGTQRAVLNVLMIRRFLFCAAILACVSCRQKSSSLRLSATTSSPGYMALNIDLQDSQKKRPVALQWSFYYSPAAITQVSVVKEMQLRSSTKRLACSSTTSRTTCIVWGGDAAAISDGTLARAQFALSRNSSHSDAVISLRDVAASSREGTALQLASAPDYISSNPLRTARLPDRVLTWVHARYSEARSAVKHYYHSR